MINIKAQQTLVKFNKQDVGTLRFGMNAQAVENGTHTDPTDLTDNNGGGENTQIT